jgi:hypothetical protein
MNSTLLKDEKEKGRKGGRPVLSFSFSLFTANSSHFAA